MNTRNLFLVGFIILSSWTILFYIASRVDQTIYSIQVLSKQQETNQEKKHKCDNEFIDLQERYVELENKYTLLQQQLEILQSNASKIIASSSPSPFQPKTFGFCPKEEYPIIDQLVFTEPNPPLTSPTESICYNMTKTLAPAFQLCMYLPEKDMISRFINGSGMWEGDTTLLVSTLVGEEMQRHNPRKYMLDIGANQGLFGFIAVSWGMHVVMVEPIPPTADLLRQTINKNGWQSRVRVLRNAVNNARTSAYVNFNTGNSGASTVTGNKGPGQFEVHAVTSDDIINKLNIWPNEIFLIKIDTEGFDYNVLDGAYKIITEGKPPVILFENTRDYKCKSEPIIKKLYELGYVAVLDYSPSKLLTLDYMLTEFKHSEYVFVLESLHQELVGHIERSTNYIPQISKTK